MLPGSSLCIANFFRRHIYSKDLVELSLSGVGKCMEKVVVLRQSSPLLNFTLLPFANLSCSQRILDHFCLLCRPLTHSLTHSLSSS
mmetsp:Transcript_8905/g.24675  ORF Transcript_8905/g.24675 Transcript_8905/m.24675 type:complete len:86 (+) Transcript_8905:39-296(+)